MIKILERAIERLELIIMLSKHSHVENLEDCVDLEIAIKALKFTIRCLEEYDKKLTNALDTERK